MNTPVCFKSQNSDGVINKYASSSLLTTIGADYVVAVISNFQMIVPTVNGKTIKIMHINLKTNVREEFQKKPLVHKGEIRTGSQASSQASLSLFFLLMPLSVRIRPFYLT